MVFDPASSPPTADAMTRQLPELGSLAKKAVARARTLFAARGAVVGQRPQVHGRLFVAARGTLRIGDRLVVDGKPLPTKFTVGKRGELTIGERAFFNYGVDVNAQVSITIGDNVRVGPLVSIVDDDMHETVPGSRKRAPITIGDNVWIGRGATIGPGLTIGDHAIIGANSVVTRPVASATIVGGSPARLIRELDIPLGWRRS